jgi:uncharacterized damage-inducible protein DinB
MDDDKALDTKATLHRYLKLRRDDLLRKLDGLDEYDVRRPMTPTGTNLLGLVKHVASIELGYFGETFGRRADRVLPWFEPGAEANADMWVPADETRESIIDLHHYAGAHADATIDELPLDARGEVPWWPAERRVVTLHRILVHMCVERAHHVGHADVVRELIDGGVGRGPDDPNLPFKTPEEWAAYRERIEASARQAASSLR